MSRGYHRWWVSLPMSLAACIALAQGTPPALPALAELALPASIRVERVMDDARIDGRSAAVLRLQAPWPCAQMLALVRSAWRAAWSVPLVQTHAEGWLMLSAAFRDGLLSAQWQAAPAGGCQGFLTRWPFGAQRLPATQAAVAPPWPGAPAPVRWLGRTESGAGVRRQTTWLAHDDRPLDQALPDWRQWLLRAGWRLRPDFRPNPADPGAGVLLAGERSGPAEVGLLLRPRRHITELVLIVQGDSA